MPSSRRAQVTISNASMTAVAGTTSIVWSGSGLPSLMPGEGQSMEVSMVLPGAVPLAVGMSSWPKGRDCGDQLPGRDHQLNNDLREVAEAIRTSASLSASSQMGSLPGSSWQPSESDIEDSGRCRGRRVVSGLAVPPAVELRCGAFVGLA
jgi:hypothetical protein